MALASGCSLPFSRLATNDNNSSSFMPSTGKTEVNVGRPSVNVPVLSITRTSIFSINSRLSAFLIKIPAAAPRPVPTIIDIGVAKPSAHGQAIIRTATAFTIAKARRGSGPHIPQIIAVIIEVRITTGTKYPATISAIF